MCQVEEEYNDQLERAPLPSVSKKCVKCREGAAAVVIRAGDPYCRECFKEYFIHKFRAMLGKNRLIFPGEKVLLAVSGGPSSCSMLGQVQEGLSLNAHKKLRFIPGIVYIDEGGAVGQSAGDRQTKVAELQSVFKATGFPYRIVPLEQVLHLPSSVLETVPLPSAQLADTYKAAVGHFIHTDASSGLSTETQTDTSALHIQDSDTHALQRVLASAKTLTAKEDLLHTLRQHLLVHTARTEGYSKLMMGESCTRLAVKLLTSISVGRGAQLAEDTGFSDSRYGDVITVRPMRDYSAKEIAFYNHMFHVPSVFIPSLDTKAVDKASIQRLTETFVTKLQADFPSTVSTIYRTSEKLQSACRSSSAADRCHSCLLCMSALDSNIETAASALQATQISEKLSQNTSPSTTLSPGRSPPEALGSDEPTGQCCSSGGGEDCGKTGSGGGCCSTKKADTCDLKSLLCYSCRLTIKDMASVELLPDYILSEAQRRQRRSHMREEIGEFLLDEADEANL
ncbi:cytoplasmic tRNA 2-thiolation protein 2 [Genypterus blacodes]|uniref:cytoplasmic tRNA 2-thiolation protein 2 n=1 Tax=Genypterus blacodes TaxID=154954 RepID=UPI003F75B8EB